MRVALWLIALLLLVPQAFTLTPKTRVGRIGLANVFAGDEPHYMLMLNSLLRDHDLDMANNYRAVHLGSDQAGVLAAGAPLDHHTTWLVDGQQTFWPDNFRMDSWARDVQNHPVPIAKPGVAVPQHEYSYHWPGLPVLLSVLLFPLTGTIYLEPAVALCSWIATVLAMLAFVSIARSFGATEKTTVLVTALCFLGTPIWHYSRALFSEPYALACVLGAHALYLQRWSTLWVGGLCALSLLLKNAYILFAAPLGLHMLLTRRWRDALGFSLPLLTALVASAVFNHALFGSYTRGPQGWVQGELIGGTARALASRSHGLLPYAPIVISALLGWPAFLRARRPEALMGVATFAGFFALASAYAAGGGGYCYGPRYLTPVIPFLMLGLLFRLQQPVTSRWQRADIVALGALSVLINALGAVAYWRFFSVHPLTSWFS